MEAIMRAWIVGGAVLLFLAAAVFVHVPYGRYWGPGPRGYGYGYAMGPWMMGHYGMGPWAMGPGVMGYGSGTMGFGWSGSAAGNLNLSTNDVTSYLNRWIAFSGNPHIKVGDVTEKDADTISADIVTTDKDGLVQRFTVDRHTGLFRPEGG
jgi:hypothetical protein